jgi:hypothetical protein
LRTKKESLKRIQKQTVCYFWSGRALTVFELKWTTATATAAQAISSVQ